MKNKEQKITIVAISGGFDPLHIGHVRLFQEARKLGDKLIVILNNDNWLRAKKGYVFMPQEERKEIIKALAMVDEVALTNHPPNPKDMSVCAELASLKPHIFANGGDRTLKNIPEVAICEKKGCKMVFGVGQGGKVQSSSWLLEKYSRKEALAKQGVKFSAKKVIIFDLDGTLAESKATLDQEMDSLLCRLLEKKKVMVISGGNLTQFHRQFLKYLSCPKEKLENLFISPTSGASMYKNRNGKWQEIYRHVLSSQKQKKILLAFKKAFVNIGYANPKKKYGKIIENRESQITFSALGQKAPLEAKEKWNKESDIRQSLKSALEKYLLEFEVRLGGLTSIDVTKKGIDKAYGVQQIAKILKIPIKEMVYVGDALYEGGNDYAVKRAGVATIEVKDAEETKIFIRSILNNEKK